MKNLIKSLENTLMQENWHAALAIALILPDIAGKIDYPNEISSRIRYINWFEEYMANNYTGYVGPKKEKTVFLSGVDFYCLRCSYLHEGHSEISHQKNNVLDDFVFITPKTGTYVHRNKINNKLQLDIYEFCLEILEGVTNWLDHISSDTEKQKLLEKELKIYSF